MAPSGPYIDLMFRTEIPLTPHPRPLSLAARVLTIGSCFSDVLGNRLSDYKVKSLTNPFGTVFNPLSACKLLRAAAGEETDWQQHLVTARGRWQSYDLHASVGADSPVALLQHIQEEVRQAGEFLQTADVVIFTLGTAYAYRLRETQEIVSNCHKVPADQFEKELLTPDEIINAIAETHALLRRHNPALRFVLTVSPVRHTKDTLPLNAVSKSVLRVACHYLSELLPDVTYFPAYELLLDDLRDYRFYAADMIHPSPVAEDYVWERFSREYFDSNFGRFRKEWDAVRQALAHRPLHPAAPEHRQFLEATLVRLQQLGSQVDVRMETREVQKQLNSLPLPIQPQWALKSEPEEDGEERIDIGEIENAPQPFITPVPTAAAPVSAPILPQEVAVGSEPAAEETEETPATPYKKKRRSRGGAKRSSRKKAAALAASLADVAAEVFSDSTTETEEFTSPEAEPELSVSAPTTATSYGDVITENATPVADEGNLPPSTPNEPEAPLPSAAQAPARPKRRTAAQVKAAKTSRKPAKATAGQTTESKPKPARTSRHKSANAPLRPEEVEGSAVVASASSPMEAPPAEATSKMPPATDTTPVKTATKRRARPARKKPASSADQSTSET